MNLLLTVLLLLGQKNADIENIGIRNINKGSVNFMSIEKEIAMGRELAAEIEAKEKILDDAVVTAYMNRVGQTIAMNSDAKVPITVRMIESDNVNAYALPGGFIFVTTGLVRAADSESELAFALAHSIAHVAARHGAEQLSKGQLLNIATIPLVFLGGPAGTGFLPDRGPTLVPLTFLSFSRKAVAEADYLGIQYLFKSGYDPADAISFLEKLEPLQIAGAASGLSNSHPPIADRIAMTRQNIATLLPLRQGGGLSTSEFAIVKARLRKN